MPSAEDTPAFAGLPPGPYELSEALVLAAHRVPPGQAVTYGGLAGLLGAGGPRQAGRALSGAPDGTPWWRIVRADGSLPSSLAARAVPHYRAECTPLKGNPDTSTPGPDAGAPLRVDLARARWDPGEEDLAVLAELRRRLG
ncbi:MGMT family protein [Citricoccus nitrophenolicus]|uniref:MGMT family protein n=1 Tax=Citricoccus nitrophenolicus TaxID=863575 RepID=A0ABV0ILD2_9MICC|nr:MGMT family protein [Citricoccus sp. I39-566]WMY77761.1 MGMT family protein [Citricoccus sp. I39-566]